MPRRYVTGAIGDVRDAAKDEARGVCLQESGPKKAEWLRDALTRDSPSHRASR